MLSGGGDEVEKGGERLQVRDYLNRRTIDQVRVSTGQGSEDDRHEVEYDDRQEENDRI